MQKSLLLFLTIVSGLASVTSAYAQSVKGRIINEKNEPVPFVVIYDETTSTGVTSNAEGYYEIKLEPGKHTIVYKSMGYYLVRKSIVAGDAPLTEDVVLKEQPVEVKAVVITPGKEDPAYAIMRKVISKAPYHLNLVNEYEAEVYLRGTVNIVKIPRLIAKHATVSANGKEYHLKSGDAFMEESVNRILFHAPDKYEQKVISFRSTYPWNSNDVNPLGLVTSSLYEPEMESFISPLAPRAFNYYQYKYEGFFEEGNRAVFKIKVIPKRNSQQLMNGYLFIVDRQWCLHSADLAMEMFFGKLSYKVIYAPVKAGAWLPVSHQFIADAAIMGINATYKYASSVKFMHVSLNTKNKSIAAKVARADTTQKSQVIAKAQEKKAKQQQEIETLLANDDLSNRDMIKLATLMAKETRTYTADEKSLEIREENRKVTVEKDAVRGDTAYWNTIRPIPLSTIENRITAAGDSALTMNASQKPVADSTDRKGKSSTIKKVANALFFGTGFHLIDSALRVNYDGLIGFNKINFNTVDGFVFRQSFQIEARIDTFHRLNIKPGIAYAFSRERLMWWTDIHYNYAPMRGGSLKFHLSGGSADYNSETGIDPTINTIASLFFRRNYLKLYQQNMAYVSNTIDLANGLKLMTEIGYRTASPLVNRADYSFFYRNQRDYTPNLVGNEPDWTSRNVSNEAAYWDIGLEFTPRHFYKVYNGVKRYQYSKFPTFYARNKTAIAGIVNSTADYSLLEVGARQKMEWGMMHAFSWNIKGGTFLTQKRIFAMDDKYFNNQDIPVILTNNTDAFRLLSYYRHHSVSAYAEAHITFTTPYLLVKYLPFLSNKLWVENLHINYLTSKANPHYIELGYSVSQIFLMGSVGVFAGFSNGKYQSAGVQVSLDF